MKGTRFYLFVSLIIGATIFSGCHIKEARVDKALAKYDFEKAYEKAAGDSRLNSKVARAEIRFDLQNNDVDHAIQIAEEFDINYSSTWCDILKKCIDDNPNKALQIAKEYGKMWIYDGLMFDKYIRDKDFENAIDILSIWDINCPSTFDDGWESDKVNASYNSEVDSYNARVNTLMNAAFMANNKNIVERGFDLYKPNMVRVDKKGESKKWDVKNFAYESAKKRFSK